MKKPQFVYLSKFYTFTVKSLYQYQWNSAWRYFDSLRTYATNSYDNRHTHGQTYFLIANKLEIAHSSLVVP